MATNCLSACHTDNEDGTWSGGYPINIDNLLAIADETEALLDTYIEDEMPDGNAGGCTGECASDIAAYMWSYRSMVLPVTSGWRVNPGTITWAYGASDVSFQPTAANDQLVYDLASPIDLYNKTITVEYEVDQAFIDSTANLQPFAQSKGDYSIYTFCWVSNGDMVLGTATATCLIDNTGLDVADDAGIQLGVSINVTDPNTPAGVVTIKSVKIK